MEARQMPGLPLSLPPRTSCGVYCKLSRAPFGSLVVATILLVEDDEQVRVLAEGFRQVAGHTTLSAASPEQTLAVLASDQPVDLLFTDLNLNGDTEAGLSLATKAVEMRPDLKVLYTAAQGATD